MRSGRMNPISTSSLPLARALHGTVEIDQEIPQEHYRAVAEIIGFVMRLRRTALQTGLVVYVLPNPLARFGGARH